MKKILITGASGFLGSYLLKWFDAREHYEVWSLGRKPLLRDRHVCIDLEQSDQATLLPNELDIVVHCAAMVNESKVHSPVLAANAWMAKNLATLLRERSVHHLIHVSSVAVYGSPHEFACYAESVLPKPETDYGFSKYIAELLLEKDLRPEVLKTHLRAGYILGPQIPERYFISKIFKKIASGQAVELVNPDTSHVSYVSQRDVALIIEQVIEEKFVGAMNVVHPKPASVREIVSTICEFLNRRDASLRERNDPESALNATYSGDHLQKTFSKLKPQSMKEILREIADCGGWN